VVSHLEEVHRFTPHGGSSQGFTVTRLGSASATPLLVLPVFVLGQCTTVDENERVRMNECMNECGFRNGRES